MLKNLEKAKRNPDSVKARILEAARRLFGEYGYHGATTRMIAADVGIDISTLYYHWGEKDDLYEIVLMDLYQEIHELLKSVEKVAHGKSVSERLRIAIDIVCDYLFAHPDAANLVLVHTFSKQRRPSSASTDGEQDIKVHEYVANIAFSMGLSQDKINISPKAKARVLAVWNSVLNFISGEEFFRPILGVDHEAYIDLVKDSLRFVLIPAFAGAQRDAPE